MTDSPNLPSSSKPGQYHAPEKEMGIPQGTSTRKGVCAATL